VFGYILGDFSIWSPCLLFHLSGLPNDGVGRLQDLSLGRRRRFDFRKQWLESRVQVSAESSGQKGSASRPLDPVTDDETSLRPVVLKAGADKRLLGPML
jgi:hypothetical protein